MPIVVDEVIISVEVTNQTSAEKGSGTTRTEDKQAIIAECVERVLEILRQKGER